jgi:hypothetical protein
VGQNMQNTTLSFYTKISEYLHIKALKTFSPPKLLFDNLSSQTVSQFTAFHACFLPFFELLSRSLFQYLDRTSHLRFASLCSSGTAKFNRFRVQGKQFGSSVLHLESPSLIKIKGEMFRRKRFNIYWCPSETSY